MRRLHPDQIARMHPEEIARYIEELIHRAHDNDEVRHLRDHVHSLKADVNHLHQQVAKLKDELEWWKSQPDNRGKVVGKDTGILD